MRRGNTETISITEDSALLAAVDTSNVRFTIQQGGYTITRENSDVTVGETTFSVDLTQEETLGFSASNSAPKVKAQVKWANTDGDILQTKTTEFKVFDTLDEATI